MSFYELSVGAGPNPHWWREAHPTDEDLVFLARFGMAGSGVVKVTMVSVGDECLVGELGLGLPAVDPDAMGVVQGIRDKFYDFSGVPADHPIRDSPLIAK